MRLIAIDCRPERPAPGQPFALEVRFQIDAALAFVPDVRIALAEIGADTPTIHSNLQSQRHVPWLPAGGYCARWVCGGARASLQGRIELHHREALTVRCEAEIGCEVLIEADPNAAVTLDFGLDGHWQIVADPDADPDTQPIDRLPWRRDPSDWFFRHFDHAAGVVVDYMLAASPLLRGRVLDVGCGDGITALGVALRCQPEQLIGIDPFRGFERLPTILAGAGLDDSVIPECLRFLDADANAMPFPDDHFDVVVSWGSLEHIAGGYQRALAEIRRVLRPGGLLFVHPGLYYGNYGHHLGEFCDEPHFHLKWPREAIRTRVLETPPNYIDRAGEFSTPAQYWQWFEELNPITVAGFERELRALDFEPWRVAIRTEDRIEYTPELHAYSMQDLATLELYVSAYNRKPTG